MKTRITVLLMVGIVWHCTPGPTARVDLSKARTGFLLADGSTISQPGTDDYSPVLVRRADDTLILVFASDRACSGCSAGDHHIFIAQSTEPYYGGFTLPSFDAPVVLQQSLIPHVIQARTSIYATWSQNMLQLFARMSDNSIKGIAISPANLASGQTFTPDPLANTAHSGDRLLSIDLKNFKILTSTNGTAYQSSVLSIDSGTMAGNFVLGYADAASQPATLASGYVNGLYIAAFGRLYTGTVDEDFGEHTDFNAALDQSGLYLSTVSVMRTSYGFSDLIVFSAGETQGGAQDLYFVNSHDSNELWLLTFNVGFSPYFNPAPYRVFVTTTTSAGNLGGVYGADNYCQIDAKNPDVNVTFKAMLADGSMRVASVTADTGDGQIDWVLAPLETYVRSEDGVTIGTTDFNSLFSFPLSAGFASTGAQVWTGLTGTWTSGNSCNGWTDGTGGASGEKGLRSSTISSVIQDSTPDICTSAYPVYCVEQPF